MLPTKRTGLYTEAWQLFDGLLRKPIIFEKLTKQVNAPILIGIAREKGGPYIEYALNPLLKRHMIALMDNFTKHGILPLLNKQKHTKRLYEILTIWKKVGQASIPIDKLRRMLNLGESYKNFAHLRRRILEPAKKELASHGNLKFNYKTVKHGRAAQAVHFILSQ